VLNTSQDEATPLKIVDIPFFDPVSSDSWMWVTTPSWSPDGEWLVYHRCKILRGCTWENSIIFKVSSNGGGEEIVISGGEFPNWKP
jgi:Tol biopolymer transport system component